MRTPFVRLVLLMLFLLVCGESSAQYYFGRNKIQYTDFNWHILKTEHFDIYYYPEMKELAEIGAAAAEESYTFLEDKFNHNITRRIPLVFYSTHAHFQQTNITPYLVPEGVGGFFEFMKGRVVVPADGSIYNFKRVIRHELIHVFTMSLFHRILRDHKKTNYPDLPLWFIEGLAEYWSIGWDTQTEYVIRDAVLNNYLFPLERMYQIYGSFLMYKEGQAVLKYIADTYGEHKIIQLIENSWKSESFSKVFKLTIGKDYKEFDEEWTYYLQKKKYPLYEESDSPTRVTRKITAKGINTKPAYYHDGDDARAIFISNRVGYSNIYSKKLNDKRKKEDAKVIIKGERTSEFEAFHILKSKIDVSHHGLLTFVSKSGETDVIYTYDMKEEKVVQSFQFDHMISMSSPSWSPDGMSLVFSGINVAGKSDLYTIDVGSGELDKLTNDYYDDRDPIYSRDGSEIYFSSDRTPYGEGGNYNLFAYQVNTGEMKILTYGDHTDFSPSLSPDGQYLAFSSDRDGVYNIWMMKLSGNDPVLATSDSTVGVYPDMAGRKELKRITNFTTAAHDPVWTGDNNLLFTAFEKFSFQIREVKDVIDNFESKELAVTDELSGTSTSWRIRKIDGKTASSTIRYKPRFTLDVAQSQITQDPIFGVTGGAQLAMTDMLGNYQYYFLLYNNAQVKDDFLESFNFAISRADLSSRTNKSYGIYRFAGRYYNWYDSFFYETMYGGFFGLSYPISMFKRIEGSINIRHSDKYWYFSDRSRKALLFSNFLSFVKDNSLWGPTGPIDGERLNITLGNTVDVQHSNVNFYTIIADYRKYFRISPRVAHAVRLMTRYNHGKEATPYYMGGSWDLRGYPRWRIWGDKIFLVSNELRFPFIDRFMINFPFGGMGFSSIRGATYVDLGNAWNDHLDSVLGSIGVGFRFRLGGVLVLRFDFGKRFTLEDTSDLFNPDRFWLQSGYYQQFFFGWDF